MNFKYSIPGWPWWLAASVLTGFTALAWPLPEVGFLLAGCGGLGLILITLCFPRLCVWGICLFFFTGILSAVEIGFSFKAPQAFALLAVLSLGLRIGFGWHLPRDLPWHWLWPFIITPLSWLPSLGMAEVGQLALHQDMTGTRLLFNYLLLLLIALVLFSHARDLQALKQQTHLLLVSCALSLAVGWLQQIGYYTGVYNPLDYLGQHSALVDFYGPFLRIAPGTFANEYGEILQTVGIILIGLLYLYPDKYQRRTRLWLFLLLVWVVASLMINFTRASWLVFVTGTFIVLALARPPWWKLLLLGSVLYSIFLGLFRLSQIISETSLLVSVGQRWGELSDISVESAGQRLESWKLAWEYFLNSPWIGNGLGRFVDTHNVPLQLLAETGVLGFLGFYATMAWTAWRMFTAWKRAKHPELRALQITWLVAFLGCLTFDLTNHGIFHFVLWACIAQGLAVSYLIERTIHSSNPSAGAISVRGLTDLRTRSPQP